MERVSFRLSSAIGALRQRKLSAAGPPTPAGAGGGAQNINLGGGGGGQNLNTSTHQPPVINFTQNIIREYNTTAGRNLINKDSSSSTIQIVNQNNSNCATGGGGNNCSNSNMYDGCRASMRGVWSFRYTNGIP